MRIRCSPFLASYRDHQNQTSTNETQFHHVHTESDNKMYFIPVCLMHSSSLIIYHILYHIKIPFLGFCLHSFWSRVLKGVRRHQYLFVVITNWPISDGLWAWATPTTADHDGAACAHSQSGRAMRAVWEREEEGRGLSLWNQYYTIERKNTKSSHSGIFCDRSIWAYKQS